jgi:mitogen-activated protein kinase kinase 7
MKALTIPGLDNSSSCPSSMGPMSSGTSSPAGSWSNRPARPRPSLNVGSNFGIGNGGSGRRPAPNSLIFMTSPSPGPNSADAPEMEKKLKEIMMKSGHMRIKEKNFRTHIDDLELICDLGNGTCGHVVKMRHRASGEVIAVKQMRRTGNSDETKRIIMDLDVVLKSHDCQEIVLCLGCFITESDVWICMELMSTCFDKLLKQLKQPIPERICGKVAVATLKALNYLKDQHGVIHRDVKPSNILLDASGRVKLCDFGISGHLVDSKAKTRSAGCAAYMAPERIDPPNPNNPNYDIRADVWSLGITLVEMAMGHFPYRDCQTDFEVLTKVLQEDPPLLPPNRFSREFELFIRDCLMKDPKDRPKYKKLLSHPFIKLYEREEVDVGAWYRNVTSTNGSITTPNNNQLISNAPTSLSTSSFDPLSNMSSTADRTSFKPLPSPRVVRSWRPSNATPTTTSVAAPSPIQQTPSYPSAISEQREQQNRRPSFESLLEARRLAQPHPDISSQYVTSKPPPALPSPSDPMAASLAATRATTTSSYSSRHPYVSPSSVTDSPMMMRSSARREADRSNYYERWQPPNGGLNYSTTSGYSSPYLSTRATASSIASSTASPYSGSYGSPHHFPRSANYGQPHEEVVSQQQPSASAGRERSSAAAAAISTVPRYGYRESPRTVRKFDFTFPQTSVVGSASYDVAAASAASGTSSLTSTPHHRSSYSRRLSTEQHHHVLPHHSNYQYSSSAGRGRSPPTTPTRQSRLEAATSEAADQQQLSPQTQMQRSPSQERQSRNYFPSSWRSTLSSWTPISFRRLRTASSDRSNAFDASRRFQPSYRSWNEKDNNLYPSVKR